MTWTRCGGQVFTMGSSLQVLTGGAGTPVIPNDDSILGSVTQAGRSRIGNPPIDSTWTGWIDFHDPESCQSALPGIDLKLTRFRYISLILKNQTNQSSILHGSQPLPCAGLHMAGPWRAPPAAPS